MVFVQMFFSVWVFVLFRFSFLFGFVFNEGSFENLGENE